MTTESAKAAKAKYDAKTARYYSLKLNQNTDADLIQHLEQQESIQGYLKRLIRDNMKEEKTMKRISIDNGAHYVTPEDAIAGMSWDVITNYMDDDTRETVSQEGPETELAFLLRYLELADADLIIG